jgi:hypothetical protein
VINQTSIVNVFRNVRRSSGSARLQENGQRMPVRFQVLKAASISLLRYTVV